MISIQPRRLNGRKVAWQELLCIDRHSSVLEGRKLMDQANATELLVTHEVCGRCLPFGIVTGDDLVRRMRVAALDLVVLTMGDIALSENSAAEQVASVGERGASSNESGGDTPSGDGRLTGTLRLAKHGWQSIESRPIS